MVVRAAEGIPIDSSQVGSEYGGCSKSDSTQSGDNRHDYEIQVPLCFSYYSPVSPLAVIYSLIASESWGPCAFSFVSSKTILHDQMETTQSCHHDRLIIQSPLSEHSR